MDGVLTIDMNCCGNYGASYDVFVPNAVEVTGRIDSDTVTLNGVSGVDLELGSSDVTIDGASGAVQVAVDSGTVTCTRWAARNA